ncbi:unnamed protein product [Sphagnum tenellum]
MVTSNLILSRSLATRKPPQPTPRMTTLSLPLTDLAEVDDADLRRQQQQPGHFTSRVQEDLVLAGDTLLDNNLNFDNSVNYNSDNTCQTVMDWKVLSSEDCCCPCLSLLADARAAANVRFLLAFTSRRHQLTACCSAGDLDNLFPETKFSLLERMGKQVVVLVEGGPADEQQLPGETYLDAGGRLASPMRLVVPAVGPESHLDVGGVIRGHSGVFDLCLDDVHGRLKCLSLNKLPGPDDWCDGDVVILVNADPFDRFRCLQKQVTNDLRQDCSDSEREVDVCGTFRDLRDANPDLSVAVAAIETLMIVLERCRMGTLQELVQKLNRATEEMKTRVDCSSASVESGGKLFLRFITLASEALEKDQVSGRLVLALKENLVQLNNVAHYLGRGDRQGNYAAARKAVFEEAYGDQAEDNETGGTIPGRWFGALTNDYNLNISMHNSRLKMKQALDNLGVTSTLILDASVGYIMAQVDCVLLGAEGVVESGGIVNKVGTD